MRGWSLSIALAASLCVAVHYFTTEDRRAPPCPIEDRYGLAERAESAPARESGPAPVDPAESHPTPSEAPPAREWYRGDRSAARKPETQAEMIAFSVGCVEPRANAIAHGLSGYYKRAIREYEVDETDTEACALAWDVARSRAAFDLAINQTIRQYLESGRLPPDMRVSGRNYLAHGVMKWGAARSAVWGEGDVSLEVAFALDAEEHPVVSATHKDMGVAERALHRKTKGK